MYIYIYIYGILYSVYGILYTVYSSSILYYDHIPALTARKPGSRLAGAALGRTSKIVMLLMQLITILANLL